MSLPIRREQPLSFCHVGLAMYAEQPLPPPVQLTDGHTALRVADVRAVDRAINASMVQQALTVREQWPPVPPAAHIDLDDARALFTSLLGQPTVTIYPEHTDRDVCYIGAPDGLGRQSLRLLEVSPQGVWDSRPTKHRIDAIRRVAIGGRYEQALLVTAGPGPNPLA